MSVTHFVQGGQATAKVNDSTTAQFAIQELVDSLYQVALERGIRVSLFPEKAQLQSGIVNLPARVDTHVDDLEDFPFVQAEQLQELEEAWSDQKTRPQVMLILRALPLP